MNRPFWTRAPIRILTAAALLGLTAVGAQPEPDPNTLPVDSPRSLDTDDFNTRVAEGVGMGEDVPADPFEVAESFAGPLEARFVSVVVRYPSAEGRKEAVVTVVRDGFLDDSLRGDWHRLRIRLHGDGGWRVEEALVAYRCYRGPAAQRDRFAGGFCL